jgi:uncharacterized protein
MTNDNQPSLDTAEIAYNRRDFQTALRHWQPLATQGNAEAQFWLGMLYGSGDGVEQDFEEKIKWWRMAAERGHEVAQGLLGTSYLISEGVPQDYAEAYFWMTLALNGGKDFVKGHRDQAVQHLSPEQKAAIDKRVAKWKPAPAPASK